MKKVAKLENELLKRDVPFKEPADRASQEVPLDEAAACGVSSDDAAVMAMDDDTGPEVKLDGAKVCEKPFDAKIQAVRERVRFEDEVQQVATLKTHDVPGAQQQSSRLLSHGFPTYAHQEVQTAVPFDQDIVFDGVNVFSPAQCSAFCRASDGSQRREDDGATRGQVPSND